jgi:phage recombination protein Bet
LFGANPLMKQIYLLPFRSGGETKYAHVISIDLARAKAHETGEFAGKSKVYFDGLPMHQWIKENPTIEFEEKQIQRGKYTNKEQHLKEGCHFPLTAEVTIYRMVNGQRCEFFHEVAFEEYYPGPSGRGQMWRQRPFGMIGKCVEMAALRSAFADSLGKMYVQEELEKAHTPETQDTAFIDLSNIAKEIEACETVDQIHAHKASHSELQNDPDYLKLLEQRAIEITNN